MRIISGTAKGRKLFAPGQGNQGIRPTSDRAREALFNIIGSEIQNARLLDLFAGTGAVGCEALSRGAAFVTFIDFDKKSLDMTRRNIDLIPDGRKRSETIRYDLRKGSELARIFKSTPLVPYDLIFADPPYKTDLSEKILLLLDKSPVLSENVLVIIEAMKTWASPESSGMLVRNDVRQYGDTLFAFYRPFR